MLFRNADKRQLIAGNFTQVRNAAVLRTAKAEVSLSLQLDFYQIKNSIEFCNFKAKKEGTGKDGSWGEIAKTILELEIKYPGKNLKGYVMQTTQYPLRVILGFEKCFEILQKLLKINPIRPLYIDSTGIEHDLKYIKLIII